MHDCETSVRMATFRKSFGTMPHKELSPQYYRWKSKENPFGQGEIYLAQREADVVGSASVTPKCVAVNGKSILAFEIGDTYTNPDYRRQGIFLEAVAHCTKYAVGQGAGLIYGTPNEASLAGYEKKANFQRIPGLRISLMTKYISRRAVESRIEKKLGKGLHSKGLASLLLAKNAMIKRISAGSVRLDEIFNASRIQDMDGLWGDRSDNCFFTVRDKTYLSWRYFDNPDDYRVMLAQSENGVSGIVVTKQYKRGGENIGVICDAAALNDEPAVAYSLFGFAEKLLAECQCDYIEAWCSSRSPYHNWLRRLGFSERTFFPVIVSRETALANSLLESTGNWHFMFGDSDNM